MKKVLSTIFFLVVGIFIGAGIVHFIDCNTRKAYATNYKPGIYYDTIQTENLSEWRKTNWNNQIITTIRREGWGFSYTTIIYEKKIVFDVKVVYESKEIEK